MDKAPQTEIASITDKAIVERAVRHELRMPMRYRSPGEQDWTSGQAINMSESGLLFSSDEVLDIDARVEVTFQSASLPTLHSSTRLVRIVRRTLANWPETQMMFGAKFCS